MQSMLGSTFRGLRSMVPRGTKDSESINFMRFHNDPGAVTPPAMDTTELHPIANGSAPPGKGPDGMTGQENGNYCSIPTPTEPPKEEPGKNKITAWQAGWNVTNAIQV